MKLANRCDLFTTRTITCSLLTHFNIIRTRNNCNQQTYQFFSEIRFCSVNQTFINVYKFYVKILFLAQMNSMLKTMIIENVTDDSSFHHWLFVVFMHTQYMYTYSKRPTSCKSYALYDQTHAQRLIQSEPIHRYTVKLHLI